MERALGHKSNQRVADRSQRDLTARARASDPFVHRKLSRVWQFVAHSSTKMMLKEALGSVEAKKSLGRRQFFCRCRQIAELLRATVFVRLQPTDWIARASYRLRRMDATLIALDDKALGSNVGRKIKKEKIRYERTKRLRPQMRARASLTGSA